MVAIGVSPDGLNVNDGCGSTAPFSCQETVVASGADIGIALDGDADRLIIVDEKGKIVDGDQIMALIGSSWAKAGIDRKSVGSGKSVSVRVDLGGRRVSKKKKT